MAAWIIPAVTAGIGVLQGMQKDKQGREAAKLQAMQNRYAPIFGQAPGAVSLGAPGGSAVAGGLAGGLGGLQTMMNYNMMKDAMQRVNRGSGNQLAMNMDTNPYGNMG